MLDLYHAVSAKGDEGNGMGNWVGGLGFGGADGLTGHVSHAALPTLNTYTAPLGTVVSEADTVMSFVNLGELLTVDTPAI